MKNVKDRLFRLQNIWILATAPAKKYSPATAFIFATTEFPILKKAILGPITPK